MDPINSFQEQVALKFQLFKGLFSTLPYDQVRETGALFPLFDAHCERELERGVNPETIVESFLDRLQGANETGTTVLAAKDGDEDYSSADSGIDLLFRFLRLVERHVVLFDALEDAAFPLLHSNQGTGSIQDLSNRIEQDRSEEAFLSLVNDFTLRVVLTAHPTQFYTNELLAILEDLSHALRAGDLAQTNNLLLQMSKTRFKNKTKPTPLDEAKGLLWILDKILYKVVPELHGQVMAQVCKDNKSRHHIPGRVEIGFWPGGDRDGNPYVSTETTLETAKMLRTSVLKNYLSDVQGLRRRMTFDGVADRLEKLETKLQATIGRSLEGCTETGDLGYQNPQELLRDLLEIRGLVERDHMGLFIALVDNLVYAVQSFGFHFATLDLRQDSRMYTRAVVKLMEFAAERGINSVVDYDSLDGPGRIDSLLQTLQVLEQKGSTQLWKDLLAAQSDGVDRDTLEVFAAAYEIQSQNGMSSLHRAIISNTQGSSNLYEVWFLARVAGLAKGSVLSTVPLDIVPLFETINDLINAPQIILNMVSDPVYRSHLAERAMVQHIMLGFSDGTKDGGYVSANWRIHRAKMELSQLAKSQGVKLVFFDGRGGPPGRGGGNSHKFYRSMGSSVQRNAIHLTVQGQTITSMFGHTDAARFNMENLLTAGLENNLFPSPDAELDEASIEVLDQLANLSYEHYQKLRHHKDFMDLLQDRSPLKYYGKTNVASRPTSRKPKARLDLEDLRAIPFVGSWSQLKLNVPGFYGFGTALKTLSDQGFTSTLKNLYQGSAFFRTLVENSMMSLLKTHKGLTSYLIADETHGELVSIIHREIELTEKMLLKISGQTELLELEPIGKSSIALREKMVLPALVIQQFALSRLRKAEAMGVEDNNKEAYEKLILKSMAASINASRNSV